MAYSEQWSCHALAAPASATGNRRLSRMRSQLQGAQSTCSSAAGSSSLSICRAVGAATLPRRQAASAATAGGREQLEKRFTVREADPSEYDRVVAIVNSAFSHWASHYVDAQDGHWQRLSVEKLREELVQGRELGLDSELLVCVDVLGEVHGTVLTNQWYAAEDFASAGRPDTASFGQLAVVPEAQGHGIGPMLVRACEERARSRDKRRMDICFVSLDASYLLPFYTALGYERGKRGHPSDTSRLRPVSVRALLRRANSNT